jgi:hypothetical protein
MNGNLMFVNENACPLTGTFTISGWEWKPILPWVLLEDEENDR